MPMTLGQQRALYNAPHTTGLPHQVKAPKTGPWNKHPLTVLKHPEGPCCAKCSKYVQKWLYPPHSWQAEFLRLCFTCFIFKQRTTPHFLKLKISLHLLKLGAAYLLGNGRPHQPHYREGSVPWKQPSQTGSRVPAELCKHNSKNCQAKGPWQWRGSFSCIELEKKLDPRDWWQVGLGKGQCWERSRRAGVVKDLCWKQRLSFEHRAAVGGAWRLQLVNSLGVCGLSWVSESLGALWREDQQEDRTKWGPGTLWCNRETPTVTALWPDWGAMPNTTTEA